MQNIILKSSLKNTCIQHSKIFFQTSHSGSKENTFSMTRKSQSEIVKKNTTHRPIVDFIEKENTKRILERDYSNPPEPPTTCCMSGCPTCVWLEYAEELGQFYKDGGSKAKEAIEKDIHDPSLKAFLMFELSTKNL